ncbi:MAG: exodeoxyribonuclease VII large subunit [Defluviitaleaceae bacterium]|nr:exodeoxyribonuclease VII large subunit [Defluviitaleaceae bacterium]
MKKNILTVSNVNLYIKSLLEEDVILSDIYIKGEISNFKLHSSGHMYFSLKDLGASINCVMFKGNAQELAFLPKNGENVIAVGRISLYEKTGVYQLYVDEMEKTGLGTFYENFEKLKAKLLAEGLFDEENKKPIPKNPEYVSIVTSPTGAAVRDIIKVARARNPYVKLNIIPTLVQGDLAPTSICEAIKLANLHNKSDVIILARGGGSIEDLWAFNDENVARAIFLSKIPTISAIGHETDFTIADFVADLRASTPSNAAEIAVNDYVAQISHVAMLYSQIERSMNYKLNFEKNRLKNLANRPVLKRPLEKVYENQIHLENLLKQLEKNSLSKINDNKNKLAFLANALNLNSPLNIMSKGYNAIFCGDNLVNSTKNIKVDDEINIKFVDGSVNALVTDIKEGDCIG